MKIGHKRSALRFSEDGEAQESNLFTCYLSVRTIFFFKKAVLIISEGSGRRNLLLIKQQSYVGGKAHLCLESSTSPSSHPLHLEFHIVTDTEVTVQITLQHRCFKPYNELT